MNRRLIVLLGLMGVVACADATQDTTLARTAHQPLELSDIDRGVGVHSGEAMGLAKYQPSLFPRVTTALPHAVLHVSAYDAPAQELGEYITFPPPAGLDSRGPVVFKNTSVTAGRFAARVDDLVEEVTTFGAEAGANEFASVSVVMDFWRPRRDWHVRWDGKLEDAANTVGRGQYGFFRTDFSEELLDDIETVARDHQPRYFVIGNEMERFLATSEGAGLAPHEFANFFGFYQEAAARIRAVSPQTKVGFGVDWNRFYNRVSALYAPDDAHKDDAADLALQTTLLPLWRDSDIIALSMHASPGQDMAPYGFLTQLNQRYGLELPVVYHSVGAPVDSPVKYLDQKILLEEFGTVNAGVPVEFMAWRRVLNFEGTDTNNQVLAGRCLALTEASRGLEMPVTSCYDGLFTSVFSAKETFGIFESL